MPDLAQLTDSYVAPDDTFPVEQLYAPSVKEDAITIRPVIDAQVPERLEPRPEPMGLLDNFGMAGVEDKSGKSESKLIKKLFGLGGEDRYQLWPEKVVRDALGAAGEVAQTDPTLNLGLRREDFTDIPPPSMPTKDSTWLGEKLGIAPVAAQPNDYMVDAAQSMAALAGSGGLAGTTDATLGAGPFLRPALKYDNKIYKAPLNGQHLDALPEHLQDTFHKQAMSGEDISHFNFGFMNHKGQFLSREAALDYAIKEGLVDPHAGQYGALTSTLLADSSKPGMAIEAMAKSRYEQILEAQRATEGFRAAMRDPVTGKVYTGSSHQNAIESAPKWKEGADEVTNGVWGRLHNEWDKSTDNAGFVDNRGKFISRSEAEKRYNVLTMEDVKDLRKSKTAMFRADSSKPGTAIEAMAKSGHNEGLSYLLAPKSQAMGIGEEAGKFNPNGFSTFKVNAPEGYLGHRIVYSENGKTLGAMQITKTPDGKPTVANTYVAPEARRQGIATKLNNEATKVYGKLERSEGPSEAGQAFRDSLNKPAQPFYSALEHNVNKITQSKMTGDQWLGTLANKPGVKPEELQWTGLQEFLTENKGKPVSKEQIEQHLAANKVELKDVDKGAIQDPIVRYLKDDYQTTKEIRNSEDIANAKKYNAHFKETVKGMTDEEILKAARQAESYKDIQDTKYHSYQLPGGSNYREKLLTLPSKAPNMTELPKGARVIKLQNNDWWVSNPDGHDLSGGQFPSKEAATEAALARINSGHFRAYQNENNYKSSHWDEPNILAHVRMNDRSMSEPGYRITNLKSGNTSKTFATYEEALTYANSLPESLKKNIQINEGVSPKKSLHLEEIQSDWHQQGRDKGYQSDFKIPDRTELSRKMDEIRAKAPAGLDTMGEMEWLEKQPDYVELRNQFNSQVPMGKSDAVPDAPFKKSWHELALKRMIREAAEKGYDRLSWTPGEAQAARYDLSKQVNKLSYNPKQQYIKAWDHNGNEVIAKDSVKPEDLPGIVGKEAAQKLLDQKPKDFAKLNPVSRHTLRVTQSEHQYHVTNTIDSRAVNVGKGTVGSEADALDYAYNHLNKSAKEINQKRELEYGRLGATHILEGQDLKVGGEGMKGFYDQIIPKALEKIGKEHGVKVKTVYKHEGNPTEAHRKLIDDMTNELHDDLIKSAKAEGFDDAKAKRFADRHTANLEPWQLAKALNKNAELDRVFKDKLDFEKHGKQPIHYIDLPQSLKDQAMHKGFPLFSGGYQFIPVQGDPFESKKK